MQRINDTQILSPKLVTKSLVIILLSSFIGISTAGCFSLSETLRKSNPQVQTREEPIQAQPSVAPTSIIAAANDPNLVVKVVQKVGPAVVRIDTSRTIRSQVPYGFEDPFFGRFFGDEFSPRSRGQVQRGNGSGFIINSNGEILTNAHVVNGADVVTVSLKDGRSFRGQVKGEDTLTDVAVIKINANNLPTVPLGNSEKLQSGEPVIAIGNPLGLDYTVTSGIISAMGRSSRDIGASDKRVDYLQTDAAINPGNSGGPLLNIHGQVIGMNTAIIRGAQGLGFAIPINTVRRISQQLIAKGRVDHPYLGIVMATLNQELKERLQSELNSFDVSADKGVLLVRVIPRSPAAISGMRAGDVIKSINNQSVTNTEQVQKIVEKSSIGQTLTVRIQRRTGIIQLSIKPAPLPVDDRRS